MPLLPMHLPVTVPMDWEARTLLEARADTVEQLLIRAPSTTTDEWPALGLCSVLNELRDAVVATDELGQIRYVNEAAEKLVGWSSGSLIGRSALDIVADSVADPLVDGFEGFVPDAGAGTARPTPPDGHQAVRRFRNRHRTRPLHVRARVGGPRDGGHLPSPR